MFKLKKKEYSKNDIDYPGVGIITDEMVAKLVRKHTHWWQRLDYHRMTDAALEAQMILMKVIEPSECHTIKKNGMWYF